MGSEKATFAAGCFWGVEETFRNVDGVLETAVGYAGGTKDHPTYEQVCAGDTGHAEVVEVTFDPDAVTYDQLLETFWKCHDPSQRNRQGPDVGSQYRSAIFFHSPEQQKKAQASLDEQQKKRAKPIATEITEAGDFWRAEEYHQQYLAKRGRSSCRI